MSKKNELNKKKVIIAAVIILVLLVIALEMIFIIKKNNKNRVTPEATDTEVAEAKNALETFSIKNTKENPIEKDGIEAESINFTIIGDQLEVKTILKNTTNEDLNGYMIGIDLLDSKGDVVTSISDNSTDVIKAKQTKEVLNYVMGLEDPKQIVSAKITSLEKETIENTLNQTFNEMTPKPEDVQQGPIQ